MTIIARSHWGAQSARSRSDNITPRGVALHWEGPHMGTPDHSQCAARVRGIQAYHMNHNGWVDIAYSAVVCPHGDVYEGRGARTRTAANGTNDGNQNFYAVCYLGGTGDTFTREGRRGFHEAIDWLGQRDGQIVGHRNIVSTDCPGDDIFRWIADGLPIEGDTANPPPPPPAPAEPTPGPTAPPITDQEVDVARLPTIAKGAKGQPVRNLQGLLLAAARKVDVDGDFGNQTDKALRAWQKAAGLEADGVAGAQTWRALLGV